MKKTNRYLTLDLIRAIAVINMVLYHLLYDLKYMFGVDLPFFSVEKAHIWQQAIAMTFVIIAGISLNFNSRKIHQAFKLLLVSLYITGVTYVFMENFVIYFGIIHFLSLGVFIVYLLQKPLEKIHNLIGFLLFLGIFIFLRSRFFLNSNFYISLYDLMSKFKFAFVLGLPSANFTSADYFPIFPWIFLLIAGFYMGKIINFNSLLKLSHRNILVVIGQKSLEIYLIHQVIIYVVLKILLN